MTGLVATVLLPYDAQICRRALENQRTSDSLQMVKTSSIPQEIREFSTQPLATS